VEKDQWTDWAFRIVLSYQADARLEAWKNGVKILDYAGPNVYNDALGPFIKVGIYKPAWREPIKSSVTQRTLYIDEVRVGDANSSFAEVSPGSGETPIPQPGSIQFATSAFSVNETASTATITANRTGGSSGPVSVNYTTTTGGTATEGADYTFTSGVLSWADGDVTTKAFSVPIINDAIVEGNETVSLALANPAGGVTLALPSAATLTIINDDQTSVPGDSICNGRPATVLGTAASDTINGTAGSDVIEAGDGNDLINGQGGNDTICGNEGDDSLAGGAGNDGLFGGSGLDTALFSTSPAGVTANLTTRTATGDGSDTFTLIEHVSGSNRTDRLTGNTLANRLFGGGGDDTLSGGDGADMLDGGAQRDTCSGGPPASGDIALNCEQRSGIP
jgi:serralysin